MVSDTLFESSDSCESGDSSFVKSPEGIPAITSGTLTLTAVGTDKPYKYERTGVTFEAGRYYEITVGMSVNLDSISSHITLQNGDKVVGGYEGDDKVYKVSIAAGATVTLDGMRINGSDIPYDGEWAGLTCLGDATINLIGTNDVKGFNGRYPGLFVPSGSTLTIQGSGSLEARSNGRGAGIGGVSSSYNHYDSGIGCGNIVITGGTIDAHSPSGTAIGSGLDASCGNITITPGVTRVKASRGGGDASDCIGQGAGGSCGTVTIGLVAGRISGSSVTYPTTIDVGSLTADYVARYGDTLTGTRTSGYKVSVCAGGNVTINNLNISGCPEAGLTCLGTATITLNETNSLTGETGFPGIFVPSASTLTIQGNGSLNAATNGNGVSRAAGIGGGDAMDCGDIVITGGNITATGGYNCAGIGGGYYNTSGSGLHVTCGNITISGGTIVATGGESAAGIGGGYNSPCGDITITTGVTSVTATRGGTYSDVIGRGFGNFRSCSSVKFGNATVFNGTAWSPDPMEAGTYGGLTLAISNSDNTWTLTPSSK